MSHHYSGPNFGFPYGDARLDLTDLYAFLKPGDAGKSILIMNVHPSASENPPGLTTAEPFAPEALYELKIDTDDDAVADIAYRVRFASGQGGTQWAILRRIDGPQAAGTGDGGQVIVERAPVSTGREVRVTEAGDYRFFAGWQSDPFFCVDHPPLNIFGPEGILQMTEIMTALETDEHVKVVVFDSAVEGFFLNHSDFLGKLEDLTDLPPGPTGLQAWPDILVRLSRAPVVSIALIRGRATGNGSEIALACDMRFASREKAILSQFEVGAGLVPGGGPMARLPRLIGRGRALEVLLGADDIRGDLAELYGYVSRSLPDADLDEFVDALVTRIASFDKRAIIDTKRLVNAASLPPDVEIGAGWDACIDSFMRPAAQERIKTLMERGFHKPGDAENRLGYYVGQLGR